MTSEQSPVLVLRDATGRHYLLTDEMLAAAAVPSDREADIERLIAGEEVSGYAAISPGRAPQDATNQVNIIANGMEILGIAWGGPTMIMGFMHMAAGTQDA